ncbi:hypothetical protein OsI_18141 [Oryza sativa Indica Group]|uniref:Uncharacterized protein n=1 Tax=Oryza sativa subsp. indica TaxID=39946 RepID=B8AWX3_ORYSI|nr:hypothetical protein OsI_18141 [Oryza sativa Indica Group]
MARMIRKFGWRVLSSSLLSSEFMEEEKWWIASSHRTRFAAMWYELIERAYGIQTWPELKKNIKLRFDDLPTATIEVLSKKISAGARRLSVREGCSVMGMDQAHAAV